MKNPLRSIAFKLSLLSSLLVLGVIGLMAHRILENARLGFIGQMRVRAEAFSRSCREAIFPKLEPFALHFTVQELLNEEGVVYAEVMDTDGKIMSHSDPAHVGEIDQTAEGLKARASRGSLLQQYRAADGVEYFDLAVPVAVRERRVGTVRMGFTRDSVEEALRSSKRQILVITAVAILAAVVGTVMIVGWITRPLPLLASAAREIGRGNLGAQVEWRSQDEIGTLARAFNEMAVANALAFAAIKEEKEKWTTLFSETHEGMALTDPEGRFLLLNETARRLFGFGDSSASPVESAPKTIQEALSRFQGTPIDELFRADGRSANFEFSRKEPQLLILAGTRDRLGPQAASAGFLWVFRDATSEKREEVLARSVLSLISHKVRTPLMASMGYLDILLAELTGLKGPQRQILQSLVNQQQKLNAMVDKLLFFASVYNPEMLVLDKKPSEVQALVEQACKAAEDYAAEKKARVSFDAAALRAAPPFLGDLYRLKEAVRNLIENAIKFNPKEDRRVDIHAAEEDGGVRISVVDNGPGIPEEEHPRLFRKFYQVDGDFTGQVDGMGLGLAYVKNVVEAHGGRVGVKSSVGRGCEFFLVLPKA